MRKNRCFKVTAWLLAMMMFVTMIPMAASANTSSDTFKVKVWVGSKELDSSLVTSERILDGEGQEVMLSESSDPNKEYTLKLEVSEPKYEEGTNPETSLPEDTEKVRMSYKLPENVSAADGSNDVISWTVDKTAGDVVFNWVSGKKDSFSADISVSPSYPETLGLDGTSAYILFAVYGNKVAQLHESVLMLNEMYDGGIAGATYTEASGGSFLAQGKLVRWTFESKGGNWYTVSSEGKYLNISAAGATLSGNPQSLYIERNDATGKYQISERAHDGKDRYLLDTSYKDNRWYRYFSAGKSNKKVNETANLYFWNNAQVRENTGDLSGKWAIAVANGQSWRTLNESLRFTDAKADEDGKLVAAYKNQTVNVWTFSKTNQTNWYYIQNENGQYLTVGDHQVSMSGSATPVYVQDFGDGRIRLTDGATCALWLNNQPVSSYADRNNDNTKISLKKVQGVKEGDVLYNLANIDGAYYRLRKQENAIRTERTLDEYLVGVNSGNQKTLKANEYEVIDYNFENEVIIVNNKEYVYKPSDFEPEVGTEIRYYTVEKDSSAYICAVKNKIGGMANNTTPRWAIAEEYRYDDPNTTDGFHRNYKIRLHEVLGEQDLYNFLNINNNYYRLRKTTFTAPNATEFSNGNRLNANQYTIPDGDYDFTNVTVTVDGITYKYSDHELEGEYESYYTVKFDRIIRKSLINEKAAWYANDEGWLDGSKEQFGAEGNSIISWHRDYNATLHEGTKKDLTVVLHSNVEGQEKVYAGTEIVLTGERGGSYEGPVAITWERENPETGESELIPGANEMEYRFIITAENAKYLYHIILTPIQE